MNIDKNKLYSASKDKAEELRKAYKANGTISWSTFLSDQVAHKEKVVELTNDDFKYGTLRVKEPCLLVLKENILFNPNRPTTWLDASDTVTSDFSLARKIDPNRALDWFPDASQPNNAQYFEPEVAMAYTLGFFAAISIEGTHVLFDLNGYSILQHAEHALQQKFYSHIELSDQPFLMNFGPHNFGNILRSARNVWIYNGHLGNSAHHAIHGNGALDVLIENINIEDYEIAGISLNAAKNVYLRNNTIVKSRTTVPVLGTYSGGRIIRIFMKMFQQQSLTTPALDTAFGILSGEQDDAFNKIIFDNGTIAEVFDNPSGIVDGNSYGIVVNPKGVAVLNLSENRASSAANETSNIIIDHCSVNGVQNDINEIVALGIDDGSHTPQIDTAGAVLRFFDGVANKIGDKYYYQGTSLSDVKIEFAKIRTNRIENNLPVHMFGTMNIPKGTQVWKDDSATYFELINGKMKLMKNNAPHLVDGLEVEYGLLCNGDTMFHVNKGTFGIRIDSANSVCVSNCSISNIVNKGQPGSELCGAYLKSHPDQGTMLGYNGTFAYGLILSAVNNVNCYNISIDGIESENGSATGAVIQNESYNCTCENIKIQNIRSSVNVPFDTSASILPNRKPISTGLRVDHDTFNINLKNIKVLNVENHESNPFERRFDIRANVNLSK